MCLIVFALRHHPVYPLIVAANRDEFYSRPTGEAAFWDESPRMLAGRDLKRGGTWIGLATNGRFAAVTNYREAGVKVVNPVSRGIAVRDFLANDQPPDQFLSDIAKHGDRFNGFNLVLGTARNLYYYSNRKNGPEEIEPGIHVLSNHLLDTPWPKSVRASRSLSEMIGNNAEPDVESIMKILSDRTVAEEDQLPDTGFDRQWERMLSPVFVSSDVYGTRTSTVIMINYRGHATFAEKSFHHPRDPGKEIIREFEIRNGSFL